MTHHAFEGFTPIKSGHIDGAKYDDLARKMIVRFSNGYHYAVHGVSQEDYQAFMDAGSQGEHYHQILKPNFHIDRVK